MIILGVDPGKVGALAFYDPVKNKIIKVIDMPTLNVSKVKNKIKTVISWSTLAEQMRLIDDHYGNDDIRVYLEFVAASPQMGVSSSFAFGRGFGGLEALFAAFQWPTFYATPASWKRHFGLGPDKEAARVKASQILPADTRLWTPSRSEGITKAMSEGRAEAALIAVFGSAKLGQGKRKRSRL